MIEAIHIEDKERWMNIVRLFDNYDIYYCPDYVYPFKIHGDGEPLLLYYSSEDLMGICVLMRRNIDGVEGFYDMTTPYGYGGFLFNGNVSAVALEHFSKEYDVWLKENGVVSVFYRFHPQLDNISYADCYCKTIQLGKTIEMDLKSHDTIWENITSKNRNMIRKAVKNGIFIEHGQDWHLFEKFMEVYNSTMEKDHADKYYFFDKEFYRFIYDHMKEECEIFYAKYNGTIIAMSMMFFANGRMHYHLSGSLIEYRNLAPSNLLLYEAAKWGCLKGLRTLHLGGGLGSREDNLYKFKKEFNRHSNMSFSIGKQIVDKDVYDELVRRKAMNNSSFNMDSAFFPLYRLA